MTPVTRELKARQTELGQGVSQVVGEQTSGSTRLKVALSTGSSLLLEIIRGPNETSWFCRFKYPYPSSANFCGDAEGNTAEVAVSAAVEMLIDYLEEDFLLYGVISDSEQAGGKYVPDLPPESGR